MNVAVPVVAPEPMVSAKSATTAKSPADAVAPLTDTVTAVAAVRGAPFSVPVTFTLVAPASSPTFDGSTVSVTPVEAVSLSLTVTTTSAAVTAP